MKSVLIWITAIAACVLVIGAYFVVRSGYEKHQQDQAIQKEIDVLKQEAEALEGKNKSLSEKIEYFKTEDFKEKLAKEKLNYKKEGEELVVIKPHVQNESSYTAEENVANEVEPARSEEPNYQKWWNYFFGH